MTELSDWDKEFLMSMLKARRGRKDIYITMGKRSGKEQLIRDFYKAIEEEENTMTRFKVGDKVRLKEKFYDEPYFKKCGRTIRKMYAARQGNIYTVSEHPYDTDSTVSTEEDDEMFWFDTTLLKLAEKPAVEVKRKAKCGEWIKVTKTHCDFSAKVGETAVVTADAIGYNIFVNGEEKFVPFDCAVLLEDYVPMRKWTDTEVTEAKCIIADAYAEAGYRMTCSHGYDVTDKAYLSVMGYRGKTYEARCCPTDEPNPYIGLMVVLSKATGRKLPVWIRRGT